MLTGAWRRYHGTWGRRPPPGQWGRRPGRPGQGPKPHYQYIQIDGDTVKEFARAAVHVAQEFHDIDRQFPVNETPNPEDGKAAPFGSGYKPITEMTLEDLKNLTVGLLHEIQQKEDVLQEDDRCTRIAKQKYDTWPSAYASGAVVRCRRGEIWKKKK